MSERRKDVKDAPQFSFTESRQSRGEVSSDLSFYGDVKMWTPLVGSGIYGSSAQKRCLGLVLLWRRMGREIGRFTNPLYPLSRKGKVKMQVLIAQSRPTPSDPMDCSLPGSYIHGIFQARVLEWGASAFSELGFYLSHQLIA